MSHSAENVKVGPLRFINIHSVAKYQNIEEGPFWDIKKILGSRTVPKKIERPFNLVRFCRLP